MSDAIFAYVTTSSEEEAFTIADALVEERLIACANVIGGMRSVYRWQGKVERGQETVLILKTRAALLSQVVQRVKALHSYDCPCVVSWPITGGNADFLSWIAAETKEP